MSFLAKLIETIEEGRNNYLNWPIPNFYEKGEFFGGNAGEMALGDNLDYIKYLAEKENLKNSFKLIYVDPPFLSKANYLATINHNNEKYKIEAYQDTWQEGGLQYYEMLITRLYGIKELLSEEGLLWIHLDWHSVHYVKVILDEIFGEENFVNEIIWQYKSGGSTKKHFSRKHDTILVYSKSKKYKLNIPKEKSYNRGYKPYKFKGVEEFQDELGWYTLVNMKDVWNIDMVGRTSKERTGYATQKPETLLERIILASTEENDLCGDFFGGSGTFAHVANKLGRRWYTCDNGILSQKTIEKRLLKENGSFKLIVEEAYTEELAKSEPYEEKVCDYYTVGKNIEGKHVTNNACFPKSEEEFKAQLEGLEGDVRIRDIFGNTYIV